MARDPDDCVSRDAVWTEYIRKELTTMQLTTEFTPNTRTIHSISEKPNKLVPTGSDVPLSVEALSEADKLITQQVSDVLRRKHAAPNEKFKHPLTTSHDIGWWKYPKGQLKPNPLFNKPRSMTEETRYAQRYINGKGKSPFAA